MRALLRLMPNDHLVLALGPCSDCLPCLRLPPVEREPRVSAVVCEPKISLSAAGLDTHRRLICE